MGRRVNEDMGSDSRIGKREANGVVDAPQSDFVGAENKRSNGEACSVAAGALIPTS
jgi:hypothetical protein